MTTPESPQGNNEARGFALYVGVDEKTARAAGTNLVSLVASLRKLVAEMVPAAADETYAAVALAPVGTRGKPIDVVRTVLRDPKAIDSHVKAQVAEGKVIVVDASRKQVTANGGTAPLTAKEFELLNYLLQNPGETLSRRELIEQVWGDDDLEQIPSERAIDVHIRRLRSKIAGYENIIRTVRGGGYRFDQRPDVFYEI